jgi:excisionase family DNA binding protein
MDESDFETAAKMAELITNTNPPRVVKPTKRVTKKFKPQLVADANHLTTDQVAKTLGVAKETVYAAVRTGKLSATHKGKDPRSGLLISKDSLEQFKKSRAA